MTIKQHTTITSTFTQHGANSTQQQILHAHTEATDPLDALPDDAMFAFVRATAQALESLRLDRPLHDEVERTLSDIRAEVTHSGPTGTRLAKLAHTLRGTLEQASGNLLSAALIGLWHP